MRDERDDPLALDQDWACPLPLTGFEQALELTLFQTGLTREQWLKRLAAELHRQALLPVLWLLPRGWRLSPAQLPPRLQTLAGIMERGLLTPTLLTALADDLPHLLPAPGANQPTALELWQRQQQLPGSLEQLLDGNAEGGDEPLDQPQAPSQPQRSSRGSELSGGLVWHNVGLEHDQSAAERRRNSQAAMVLNRLGANLLADPVGASSWSIDGCSCASSWVESLLERGWQARAQLRCSVASFGLGASVPREGQGWSQVPLALPIRTGLLDANGEELRALLPHSCLEMELSCGNTVMRLQYYQGTEGLCGWEGLNDLHRPWQNDRHNGTVRYLGEPWQGDQLLQALRLCDVIALIHNLEASERQLLHGGYGSLGFCIDSSALLQQAMEGRCQLFPVLLGGIWRERLGRRCDAVAAGLERLPEHQQALERYRRALEALPLDSALHGPQAQAARQRLLSSQPGSSPFRLVEQLRAG